MQAALPKRSWEVKSGLPIVPSIEIEDFNLQEVQQPYDLNNLRSISSSGDGKCRSYLIMILKIYF